MQRNHAKVDSALDAIMGEKTDYYTWFAAVVRYAEVNKACILFNYLSNTFIGIINFVFCSMGKK